MTKSAHRHHPSWPGEEPLQRSWERRSWARGRRSNRPRWRAPWPSCRWRSLRWPRQSRHPGPKTWTCWTWRQPGPPDHPPGGLVASYSLALHRDCGHQQDQADPWCCESWASRRQPSSVSERLWWRSILTGSWDVAESEAANQTSLHPIPPSNPCINVFCIATHNNAKVTRETHFCKNRKTEKYVKA